MLRELAQATQAQGWAIGAMLFFVAVFAGVVWRTLTRDRALDERCARLPLDEGTPDPAARARAVEED
jgi:hypothetical protein